MNKKAFEKSLDQVINVPYEEPGPEETIESMPSAQPDLQPTCNQLAKDANVPCIDTIYRQEAIDAIMSEPPDTHYPSWYADILKELPSAQPERLTDDDFETIRIHLNAYKEKLCNQRRWEEAEEYQRIIDRFMAFASAQPEQINPCTICQEFDCYGCKFRRTT